jgi:Transcriptional regulators
MTVTRADVAKRAGVSPALVSYVLNGGPRSVSSAARERIERAIDELDYRPNSIAQALRGASTKTIGLLIPSAVNRFFGELATAIEKELFEVGNTLAVGISADDPTREARYIDTFLDRRVDGIMVISSHSRENLARLAEENTMAVVLDRVPADLGVPSISVDNRAGVTAALDHLRQHGHATIGCLGGRIGTESADERVDAWRGKMKATGLRTPPALLARADFTERGGYDAALSLLGDLDHPDRRPTAVFVSSDIQTTGVLRACHDLGIRVPEDLAIVSFDGTLAAAYSVPSITSYRQPTKQIAQQAVRELLAGIAEPGRPTVHSVLPGRLAIGTSCGCPPTATEWDAHDEPVEEQAVPVTA